MKPFQELFIPVSYLEEGDIVAIPDIYIEMEEKKGLLLYRKSHGEPCTHAIVLYKRKVLMYNQEPNFIVYFAFSGGIKWFYIGGDCKIQLLSFHKRKTLPLPLSLLECGDVFYLQDALYLFVNVVDELYTTINFVELTPEILKMRSEIIANQQLFYHPHHLYFATSGYLELNCEYLSEKELLTFPTPLHDEIVYYAIQKELKEIIDDNHVNSVFHCVFPVLYNEPCNHVTPFLCAGKPICERCFRTICSLCLYPIPNVIKLYREKLNYTTDK